MHRQVDWMVAADDAVLHGIHRANMALSPSVLAHNLGYNRDYIAQRCRVIADHGLIEKEGDGGPFYSLTRTGIRYVSGELSPDEITE